MPASITTLPPELIGKVFRSLDRCCDATHLAQTSPLMYAVWRDNRSALCKVLVWNNPLFWRYSKSNDNSAHSFFPSDLLSTIEVSDGVTLVESAKQLERARPDYDEHEDGFVAAKRIVASAFQVRDVASDIVWQINEYWEGSCPFEYRSQEETAWFRLAEPTIGRMLYRLLIYHYRGEKIRYRKRSSLQINGEVVSKKGLSQLIDFIVQHDWEFPDVAPLTGTARCGCHEIPDRDMELCDHQGWEPLVHAVASEYEELAESSESSGSDWQLESDSKSWEYTSE
ncbi:hypothetical protein BDD12DRAFT_908359 [Trichophaea hybrida]|nr:hypothetical protein BDD12DRAFT_908359 [Trichophaea hybrida]